MAIEMPPLAKKVSTTRKPKPVDRSRSIGLTVLFFALPLLVLVWTSAPVVSSYTLHLGVLAIVAAVSLTFARRGDTSLQLPRVILHTLIILLLVGGTGWFLSPFFFLLYLLPFYLGFLYVPSVAFGFLAAILVIFASSVGEVDIAFDLMTLLSLLLVIPLIIYLRRKYLVLRQSNKEILILENESHIKDAGTISSLLSNRVTSLGVDMRQPLTFIKQAAILLVEGRHMLTQEEADQQIERIRTTAEEALELVRSFEGETSANKVLRKRYEHERE